MASSDLVVVTGPVGLRPPPGQHQPARRREFLAGSAEKVEELLEIRVPRNSSSRWYANTLVVRMVLVLLELQKKHLRGAVHVTELNSWGSESGPD